MVSEPRGGGAAATGAAATGAPSSTRGKYTLKVVPLPGSLYTQMQPALCLTIPYTVESPRPVPLPTSLVVKNGSKMRACVSSSMPTPVSLTANIT